MRPCSQVFDYKYPGEKTHGFNRGMIARISLNKSFFVGIGDWNRHIKICSEIGTDFDFSHKTFSVRDAGKRRRSHWSNKKKSWTLDGALLGCSCG